MSIRSMVMTMMVFLLAVGGTACGKKDGDAAPAGKSYTVRGKVVSMSADGTTINVHHEAIPGFENAMGKTSTMGSMEMPFSLNGTSLDGIDAGDLVEMTFHTDWKAKPALRVDKLVELPAGTDLKLE